MFHWTARIIVWVCAVFYFRLWVKGLSNVPKSGGVLVVANHTSYLDPPLVGISIPRIVRIMAKIELFEGKSFIGRIFSDLITCLGAVAVRRNNPRKALEYTVTLLEKGETILMFPEGTRSETPRMEKCKSGAVRAGMASGCWIVPTVIVGTHRAMPKRCKFPRPVQIRIIFGTPYKIDYRANLGEEISRDIVKLEVCKLAERMRDMLPEELQPSRSDMTAWYG